MKKLMMFAAPLVLAGCAQEAAEEAAPAEAETAAVTTANGSPAGTYSVTGEEGPQGNSNLNADGTYQDLDVDGNVVTEGTWAVVLEKTCFTANTEGAEAVCWSEGEPGEDGSFTATSDDGETVTVTPAAAEAEEDAMAEEGEG